MNIGEPTILTNMCMIYDGDRILVQERVDPNWSGVTFPGGHVEPGESVVKSVIREVYEETGLTVSDLRLCGFKQWIHEDGLYRYIVFFYKTNHFTGALRSSDEGRVFWINRSDLGNYKLANTFEKSLDIFENDQLSENYYWFEDGKWNSENL